MATLTAVLPFQPISPQLAVGSDAPAGWHALAQFPLLILVGVTGVGKSTLLSELAAQGSNHFVLPDRRELTDQLIIRTMQVADGAPVAPVTDRGQRFALTRRFREKYEGGMAHALTQLWVSTGVAAKRLIFDGLRGDNEVTYAAPTFPRARFVMLDAPDTVRLRRLLGRGDAFDRIEVAAQTGSDATGFAALGVPGARAIFSVDEEATILAWLQHGEVTADALRGKLQIVVEERQSYDPVATLAALRRHAPNATLYIDTVHHSPAAVAGQLLAWLNE